MIRFRFERLEDRLTPAVPFVPDPSFGTGGRASVGSTYISTIDASVGPDGDVWVLDSNSGGTAVRRTTSSGQSDLNFGTSGSVAFPQGSAEFSTLALNRIVVQPDGRALVAGLANVTSAGQQELVVYRLTATGTIDATFGNGGRVLIAVEPAGAAGTGEYDVTLGALQPLSGGGILIAGFDNTTQTLELDRLTSDGQPDPAFGTGGEVRRSSAGAGSVTFQADGTTLVIGKRSGQGDFATVTKLDAAGQLDPTFGTGGTGEALLSTTAGSTLIANAVTQPDGSIVVAARSEGPLVLVRLDASGKADPGFGTGGIVTLNPYDLSTRPHNSSQSFYGVQQFPNGTLVVFTGVWQPGDFGPRPVLALYTADGNPRLVNGTSNFYALPTASTGLGNLAYPADLELLIDGQGRPIIVGTVVSNVPQGTFLVRLIDASSPVFPPQTPAVLASASTGAVRAVSPTSSSSKAAPFAGYTGAVHVALADLDHNGVDDEIYGIGPGGGSRVLIRLNYTGSGAHPQSEYVFDAFESGFTGGVFVAAGDLDNDGRTELLVTAENGGGGRVQVYTFVGGDTNAETGTPMNPFSQSSFSPGTLVKKADFLGIDDANFRGGATARAADLDGDGAQELVVAAGIGGGPRVAVFTGATIFSVQAGLTPPKLINDFFAFPGDDAVRLRNGVAVAAADLNRDGREDLIFGGGNGGAPRVFAVDGKQLLANALTPLANFFVAGDTQSRAGVQLVARDLDGDGRADLAAVASGDTVRVYNGRTLTAAPTGEPTLQAQFDAFADTPGVTGVFVG